MSVETTPVLVTADLTGCGLLPTLGTADIHAAFESALIRAGATIVRTTSHQFPAHGLTSVLVLAESHAVLHTWPETGTVHIDIFTCSPLLAARQAIDDLARAFGALQVDVHQTRRAGGRPRDVAIGRPQPDRARGPAGFIARAAALSVALFGALRLPWVEQQLLWPFTLFQEQLATIWSGGPHRRSAWI